MEKIWLKQYQKGVPAEINPDIYPSLNHMLEEACQKYQDRPAFASFGKTLTFQEVEEYSRYFASFLQNTLKLPKGERIGLMMPNILQFPIALFGALRAGLVVVNINPLYTPRELQQQLQDAECNTVVVLTNFAHTLEQVLKEFPVKNIIVTELGDCLSFPKSMIINFVVKYIKKMIPAWQIPSFYSFKDCIKKGKAQRFTPLNIQGNDIAFLQYTGGTTGKTKGAILTHRNMIANLEQASAWVKPIIRLGEEIVITALPLYHIFSLTANCLTFMVNGGLNVLIINPRDMKSFIKEMGRYPFTVITGVNTLFNALLNQPKFHQLNFKKLHITLGGGMAVQEVVANRWKKVTGVPLIEAYGLTEASPAVCINPLNLKAFNASVGLPVSSTAVTIRDDEGNEVPLNQRGELWIKGPQVTQGYWKKPNETQEAFTEGWLHTGDIATMDEEGYIRIVDRKKDMILVSGFNVYPAEVEDVIAHMEEVAEVAVVGVHSEIGEQVKAFIVKKNPTLTAEKVVDYCRKQLTAYKIPKEVEFCVDLPKTNVGKILRRALKE